MGPAGCSSGSGGGTGGAGGGPGRLVEVTRITDGDTIRVRFPDGSREAVRYIGIDTPERDEPCYDEAARANRDLARRRVRLVFDAEREDRFGRLLAYVYSADGAIFINERLVRDGFARPLRIAPNVRFARRFERLAQGADRGPRGCGRIP